MAKLIFTNLDGIQDVLDIFPGGGCNDKSKEIWNEITDGPLPKGALDSLGGLVRIGNKLTVDQDMLQKELARRSAIQAELEAIQKAKVERIAILKKALESDETDVIQKALVQELQATGFLNL